MAYWLVLLFATSLKVAFWVIQHSVMIFVFVFLNKKKIKFKKHVMFTWEGRIACTVFLSKEELIISGVPRETKTKLIIQCLNNSFYKEICLWIFIIIFNFNFISHLFLILEHNSEWLVFYGLIYYCWIWKIQLNLTIQVNIKLKILSRSFCLYYYIRTERVMVVCLLPAPSNRLAVSVI